jgi:hypothetical protein
MGINRRLLRLEGRSRFERCPECGTWLGPLEECDVEVVWEDNPGSECTEKPVVCPLCLEPSFTLITWGDVDDEMEEQRRRRRDSLR